MTKESIWIDSSMRQYTYDPLLHDEETDVAVIGGGICGITTAQLLQKKGLKVTLLEAHRLAESNTGRSTGNLYSVVDIPFRDLKAKYPMEDIQQIIKFRQEAMDLIQSNIFEHGIECSYKKVPWVRFSGTPECDEDVKKDFEIAQELGLSPEWLERDHDILIPLRGRVGFLLHHQAQFNPFQYAQDLAHILSQSISIHEETHVEEIEKEGEIFIIKTPRATLRAKYVVEATHTPLGFSPLQMVLGPYREYGIAGAAHGMPLNDAIHWGYYEKDKVTSIRNFEHANDRYLLIIGEPHKVGQGDSRECMDKLINRGRSLGLIKEVTHQWGGQHYRPADYLPFIGQSAHENQFVATGFSTDGLVYGTLSALILAEALQDNAHPAASLFNPKRITPMKSAKKFLKENLNVLKQYASDYLRQEKAHELSAGEGMVVSHQGKKYALSKDEAGLLTVCSAVCPHMGCIVHWNNAENSWDCPCHGSRFEAKGEVIEGPALSALDQLEAIDEEAPLNFFNKDLPYEKGSSPSLGN